MSHSFSSLIAERGLLGLTMDFLEFWNYGANWRPASGTKMTETSFAANPFEGVQESQDAEEDLDDENLEKVENEAEGLADPFAPDSPLNPLSGLLTETMNAAEAQMDKTFSKCGTNRGGAKGEQFPEAGCEEQSVLQFYLL